jgi:hypothetical protein
VVNLTDAHSCILRFLDRKLNSKLIKLVSSRSNLINVTRNLGKYILILNYRS